MVLKEHNLSLIELPFLLLYAFVLALIAGISLLVVALFKTLTISYKTIKYSLRMRFLKAHLFEALAPAFGCCLFDRIFS